MTKVLAVAAVLLLCGARLLHAQQTREEEHTALQIEKAKDLHPYTPTPVERRLEMAEHVMMNPPPYFPFVGSIFPGGLLAFGPRYQKPLRGTGSVEAHAGWSLKSYKLVSTEMHLPDLGEGRVSFDAHANWVDAPRVDFYGLGNSSHVPDKARYLYRAGVAGGSMTVKPLKWASAAAGAEYLHIVSGGGTGGTPIDQAYGPETAPGLGAAPTYAHSIVAGEIDWRQSAGYSRRGGLYRFEWSDFHDTGSGAYSFRRQDAEVAQYLPLLRENWVIALHGLVSATDTDPGAVVPYFMLPSLGGSSDLRGYPTWRFRDRNRLLLTGEYRWTAGQFVDMAIFIDAGKVAPHTRELDLHDLKRSYGIGVRFHAPSATALRFEVAKTRDEGIGFIFAFGPVF